MEEADTVAGEARHKRPPGLEVPTRPERDYEALQAYLNAEISHLQGRSTRLGWSTWVLAAACAAVLWTLLAELQSSPDVSTSLMLAVGVLSIATSLRSLALALEPAESTTKPRYYRLRPLLGAAAPALLLDLAVIIGSLWVISNIGEHVGTMYVIGIMVILVLAGVARLGALVMLALNVPLSANTSHPGTRVLAFASFVGRGIGASLWLIGVFASQSPAGLPEVKSALLITGLVILFTLLAEENQVPFLLGPLVRIRRDLALGALSTEEARRQAEFAVAGLEVSEVLRPIMALILESESRLLSLTVRGRQKLESMRLLASTLSVDDAEAQLQGIKAIKESLQQDLAAFENEEKVLDKLLSKLQLRAAWLIRLNPASQRQANGHFLAIRAERQRLAQQAEGLRAELQALVLSRNDPR